VFKLIDQPADAVADVEELTLIDKLLAEQKELSAVERFSQKHESATGSAMAPHYRDLIPIRKPSTGEQYAFEVDLDKCTGCKSCVVACHSLNGLNDNESWRDVGSISGEVAGVAQQQTVTSACHHCAEPGCLSGCPVGAYEKEKDTGVVRHLDDQCIGCQYCSLKCPYDVPKYDSSLGIVRKCDMCHDRLAEGEAPACVQSCPNGAIKITLIETQVVKAVKAGEQMIAGAFRSDYTFPTTQFISDRELDASMKAADETSLEASHNHTPLVWMLMLTQVAVGITLGDLVARTLAPEWATPLSGFLAVAATLIGKIGLGASMLHLGSPLGAWRAFLGVKTSWLSREIIMFGAWMPALMAYAALLWLPQIHGLLPEAVAAVVPNAAPAWMTTAASVGAVGAGLLSVFCSVMVYVDTKRDFWTMGKTLGRFFGTSVEAACVGLLVAAAIVFGAVPGLLVAAAIVAVGAKALVEGRLLLPARDTEWSYAKQSALIQLRTLRSVTLTRWVLFGVAALMTLTSGFLAGSAVLAVAAVTGLVVICGEWLEKKLFFQAVVTLKMPGMVKT